MFNRNVVLSGFIIVSLMTWNFISLSQEEWALRWDIIPVPEPAEELVGQRPVLPFIDQATGQVNLPTDLNSRLEVLIQNHPSPEVRVELSQAIEKNLISVRFAKSDEYYGLFQKAEPDDVNGSALNNTKFNSFIMLNEDMMRNIITEIDTLGVMIIVYHETMHYLVWRDDIISKVLPHPADLGNWDAECAYHWQDEDYAYRHGCKLQRSWGLAELPFTSRSNYHDHICSYYNNDAGWRQQLWKRIYAKTHQPKCKGIYAKLAGHPNQEALQ